jgi:hypothetical protein
MSLEKEQKFVKNESSPLIETDTATTTKSNEASDENASVWADAKDTMALAVPIFISM